jgi:hypothetical protein
VTFFSSDILYVSNFHLFLTSHTVRQPLAAHRHRICSTADFATIKGGAPAGDRPGFGGNQHGQGQFLIPTSTTSTPASTKYTPVAATSREILLDIAFCEAPVIRYCASVVVTAFQEDPEPCHITEYKHPRPSPRDKSRLHDSPRHRRIPNRAVYESALSQALPFVLQRVTEPCGRPIGSFTNHSLLQSSSFHHYTSDWSCTDWSTLQAVVYPSSRPRCIGIACSRTSSEH